MAQPALPIHIGASAQWEYDGVTTLITRSAGVPVAIGADEWVLTEVDTDRYNVAGDVATITPVRSVDETFERLLGHSGPLRLPDDPINAVFVVLGRMGAPIARRLTVLLNDRVVEELDHLLRLDAFSSPFTVSGELVAIHEAALARFGSRSSELLASALLEEQAAGLASREAAL